MKENIETKDVQRTEYLDKNGLDILWAKVKENTYNQVEEECDRAQAVEGDITNKLDNLKYVPYVSKANMNSSELGDFVKYQLGATEFIISAQHGSNDATTEFRFGEVGFISRSKDSAVDIDYKGITVGLYNNIQFTNTGIRKYINRTTPAGSATEAFSTNGGVIDTTAFALKSELDSYAKKTDIPAIDTSDFVSKTTTDAQIINSILGIIGGGIQIIDYVVDSDPVSLELGSSSLTFDGCDRSTITLNASDVNSNNGSRIIIEAHNENPQILLQSNVGSDFAFQNNLTITNEGISSLDNNANHVYATDGSIADLTQYAKKSESVDNTALAALEAKVTDNTTAITNINVSKGIPYDASVTDKYQTDKDLSVKNSNGATADFGPNNGIRLSNENFEFGVNTTDCVKFSIQNDTIYSKISPLGLEAEINDDTYTHCSSDLFLEIKNRENRINLQPAYLSTENGDTTILMNHEQILIKSNDNTQIKLTPYQLLMKVDDSQVILNSNGINLPNGDNNHVLTSNASTIDITQYVLKSVYDEKIAALEARIAALEAKHAETA